MADKKPLVQSGGVREELQSGDTISMDKMSEGTNTKIMTAAERTKLASAATTSSGAQYRIPVYSAAGAIIGFADFIRDVNGNVGIGTGSPSSSIGSEQLLQVNCLSGESAEITLTEGTSNELLSIHGEGGDNSARIIVRNNSYLTFGTNNTERARIDSSGYLRMAGAGIQFNGDTAAANALNDYEEGTWSIGLSVGSGSVGVANSGGEYTKIGRSVFLTGQITLNSVSSPSGTLSLTGLPFANGSANGNKAVATLWIDNLSSINVSDVVAELIASSSSIAIYRANASTVVNDLASQLTSTTSLRVSILYSV